MLGRLNTPNRISAGRIHLAAQDVTLGQKGRQDLICSLFICFPVSKVLNYSAVVLQTLQAFVKFYKRFKKDFKHNTRELGIRRKDLSLH